MSKTTTAPTTEATPPVLASDMESYSQEEFAQTQNNQDFPFWSLKNKNKEFVVVSNEDGTASIRCLWSPDLGIQMNHRFHTAGQAEGFIPTIIVRNRIEVKHWTKCFKPQDDFLNVEGFNADLIPS
jgi:hypothetical protein